MYSIISRNAYTLVTHEREGDIRKIKHFKLLNLSNYGRKTVKNDSKPGRAPAGKH